MCRKGRKLSQKGQGEARKTSMEAKRRDEKDGLRRMLRI
jgi:hypothetical protein